MSQAGVQEIADPVLHIKRRVRKGTHGLRTDSFRSAQQSDPDLNRNHSRIWSEPRERTATELDEFAEAQLLAGDVILADELTWMKELARSETGATR